MEYCDIIGGPARDPPDFKPERPAYTPAMYLVGSPPFTRPQLITQYQEFNESLSYVSTAPELVFERLVANLKEVFGCKLEEEREKHAAAIEALQSSNDQLKEEVVQLKAVDPIEKTLKISGSSGIMSVDSQEASDTSTCVIMNRIPKYPVIGSFSTKEEKPWTTPHAEALKAISFPNRYSAPPILPIGLTMVDVIHVNPTCVQSYIKNVKNDCAEVHIDSLKNSTLYGASCAWLEIEAGDPHFQSGIYSTMDGPNNFPNSHNERKIPFSRPYSTPPMVVVWLAGFGTSNGNWRIKVYATDVTKTGFTIHVDSWRNTQLDFAICSWVAYPANMPGVFSGRVSTLDFRPWNQPQRDNSRYEKFDDNVFSSPPRTLLAIDSFDIEAGENMRLSVYPSSVSATGMRWHINTWLETKLFSAGLSYIALG